jgi:hypothetical protein
MRRITAWRHGRRAVYAACAFLAAFGLNGRPALAQDLPHGAAAQIQATWAEARKTWKVDAKFVYLSFDRDSANEGFQSDYVFGVDALPVLYHITHGPKGSSAGLHQGHEPIPICMLTSKVIDPAQAVSVARANGLKGNVVKVSLECWGAPLALEVWRVVADNDPNTADPNDPYMKNHIVNAMTGTYYGLYAAPVNIDPAEFSRNASAYVAASASEYVKGVRAARH